MSRIQLKLMTALCLLVVAVVATSGFLAERGLTLSPEKTRIVHIDQGFDFLGFNVRKYNGKLLIKPSVSSIAAVKEKARAIFRSGASLPQDALIRRPNPVLRGWGNYYRHAVSKEIFDGIDHAIWRMAWKKGRRSPPLRGDYSGATRGARGPALRDTC